MNSTHFLFRSLPRALVYTRLTVSCFMVESSPNCIPIVDQNQNPTHVRNSGVYLHKHFKLLFDRIKKFLDCRLHILQMEYLCRRRYHEERYRGKFHGPVWYLLGNMFDIGKDESLITDNCP